MLLHVLAVEVVLVVPAACGRDDDVDVLDAVEASTQLSSLLLWANCSLGRRATRHPMKCVSYGKPDSLAK